MPGETLISTMSGRLKQEAYKNNPDARNFIAEVATVIMHIILNDGKYNLQINPCLDIFKNRVFDYSVARITLSRDFNYFQNKDDLALTNIFLEMLNIHFSYEEIRDIMLMFSEVEDVTKDYKIVFKANNIINGSNATIDDDDNKTLTINKLTNEEEIIRYFNKKVNSGYYKNIYKLLVDFTLMIYRKGSTSIDFSFPSFNKIITFINKNIYLYWVHSKPSEELERTFNYMWKKAKPLHINKAIEVFKIPYPINKNGDFIIEKIIEPEFTLEGESTKQNCEIEARHTMVADNSSHENTFFVSQIDSVNIETKMEQLFNYCERGIIDENSLLNNINYLILNKGWTNVYDLFGDVSYIMLSQIYLAKKKEETICYHIFKPFEDKQIVFNKNFKKQLVLDTRHDARKSLRAIWYSNYTINTLKKIGELFESIKRIDKFGELKINEICNNYQFFPLEISEKFSVETILEPENKSEVGTALVTVPDEDSNSDAFSPIEDKNIIVSQEDTLLFEFYKKAETFYQTEDKIIKMHKELASAYKWSNASYYIASISYVIIKQLELSNSVRGLNYKKLKKICRKVVELLEQHDIAFSDENHYKNIDFLKEKLIDQCNMKLVIDFYRLIICIPQVNDEGMLLLEEVPTITSIGSNPEGMSNLHTDENILEITEVKKEETDKVVDNCYLNDFFDIAENVVLAEEQIVNKINFFLRNCVWTNAYDLYGDISYIIYVQSEQCKKSNMLFFYKKLKRFRGRLPYFIREFSEICHLETRDDSRKSFKKIWKTYYKIDTIKVEGLVFESIDSIGDYGIIKLKDCPTTESPSVCGIDKNILYKMYDESAGYIISESDILKVHFQLLENKEWNNIISCLASIAYILIRQIRLERIEMSYRFKKLKNLYRKCLVIYFSDEFKLTDSNHEHNIEIVASLLSKRYKLKEIAYFYLSIFDLFEINEDGRILFDTKNGNNKKSENEIVKEKDLDDDVEDDDVEDDDNDSYEPDESPSEIEEDDDNDEELVEELVDEPVHIEFEYKSKAERDLAEFWSLTFPQGYYDKYLWKNKLSTEKYNSFCKCLKQCTEEKEKGFAKRFAKAIVLYCAEWYKRKYNGNNGQKNPLEAIGLNLRTKDLWRWAELDGRLLYGNEYLESIYTLGGVPINYIVKKKYADTVMQELSDLFNNKTTEDSSKDKIFKKNNTIQYSLRSRNGSWHKLFNIISNEQEYPLANSDATEDIFKTFIEALKNRPIKHDKFSVDWIIETNVWTPLIRRKIRLNLNPEANGALNNCIEEYKLGNDLRGMDEFNLYLCYYGEGEEGEEGEEKEQIGDLEGCEHIRFINGKNGYFIGENVQDYFIFTEIPNINIKIIKIIAKNDDKYVELQKVEVASYLELYKTWKYSTYSTKRNMGDKYILLPFDYKIQNEDTSEDSPKYFTTNGKKYRFTKVNGQFRFTDLKNNEVSIYEQNNKITVSTPQYNNTFIYKDEKYFTRVVKDENGEETTGLVALIFKKSDIICTQYYDIANPSIIEEEDVIVKFKNENETLYKTWTDDNQPEPGFLKLQINVQNRKILLNAYFIPSNGNPFKRDCQNEKIIIDSGVSVFGVDADLQTSTNEFNQTVANISITNREKSYYEFKIGFENDYVVIPIIKPLDITELYKDGEFVKEYKNEREANIRIPILFKNKYSLHKYSNNGFLSYHLRYDDVDMIDFWLYYSGLDGNIFVGKTPVSGVLYYLYIDMKLIGSTFTGYKLNIGKTGIDNYKFYFWNMRSESDPYPIDCDYNNGMLDLHSKEHSKGIIFQSLKDDVCPRHYFKPIITTYNQDWPKGIEQADLCIRCFDIAREHKIPFTVFSPIYWLVEGTDERLIHFFSYITLSYVFDDELITDLIRLSKELCFAWPFIKITAWKNYRKEYYRFNNKDITIESFEDKFVSNARRLFCKYGEMLNNDISYINEFTNIYWNTGDCMHQFDINSTDKWYPYIIDYYRKRLLLPYDHGKSMISLALCFMRKNRNSIKIYDDVIQKYLTRNPLQIGFSDGENKNEVRSFDIIKKFLSHLYHEDDSFKRLINFYKRNKIII